MRRTYEERLALYYEAFADLIEPTHSTPRKRWRVNSGQKRSTTHYFDTRQEAVEYANRYHDRTGDVLEIHEVIRRIGRD